MIFAYIPFVPDYMELIVYSAALGSWAYVKGARKKRR